MVRRLARGPLVEEFVEPSTGYSIDIWLPSLQVACVRACMHACLHACLLACLLVYLCIYLSVQVCMYWSAIFHWFRLYVLVIGCYRGGRAPTFLARTRTGARVHAYRRVFGRRMHVYTCVRMYICVCVSKFHARIQQSNARAHTHTHTPPHTQTHKHTPHPHHHHAHMCAPGSISQWVLLLLLLLLLYITTL